MTYEELIKEIDELTRTYHAFAIAIDGAAYTGKRSLAAHLSKKYGAPVIHMSDFRLPLSEQPKNGVAGDEMDFERFNEEIAEPWMKKGELVYSVLDEKTGEIKERLALPNAQIYIIEGNFAWHPSVTDFYDLRLFLRAEGDVRAMRAKAADATLDPAADARLQTYFTTYMTDLLSDAVLDEAFILPEGEA